MADASYTASSSLEPFLTFLSHSLTVAENAFHKVPGSAVVLRYVKSSHQNDPGRTLLELILVVFAIRTLLQSRTKGDRSGKNFIQFTDKVIFFFFVIVFLLFIIEYFFLKTSFFF